MCAEVVLAAQRPAPVVVVLMGWLFQIPAWAGAIAAQGRAPLIGQKTYGKGSVQYVFTLSDGSSIHVTAKTWQTPDRRDLNGNGLDPDVAFRLRSGDDSIEVVIDFKCPGVGVFATNGNLSLPSEVIGDGYPKLTALAKEAFPNDLAINALR